MEKREEIRSRNKIEDFIAHFSEARHCFLYGCCYWFCEILMARFKDEVYHMAIMYEPEQGHFLTMIREDFYSLPKYYDIRGDVTEEYNDKGLYTVGYLEAVEPKYYANLMKDCRDFIEREDEE